MYFPRFGIYFLSEKRNACKEKADSGFHPETPQRRAAVHSLRLSVGSSAHSPVNSLRSNNTGSCVLLCKPFSPLKESYQTLRRGYCKSDYRNQLVTCFYLAMAKVIDKSQFANDIFETILSKFASIAFLLLFFNCIELILTQEYN